MADTPQQPSIVFEIYQGDTLQEAGQKMLDGFVEHVADGYQTMSFSHAADVSGDEPKWSIMVFYSRGA